MSTMIQIRNVPDPVHRRLKARAAEAGQSLSDYLLRSITAVASRPTNAEMLERLRARPRLAGADEIGGAELVSEGRGDRAT